MNGITQPIQFIQVVLANDPNTVHTMHVAQIADILPGPGGKATIIDLNAVIHLTVHDYPDVLSKLEPFILDLRN